MLKQNKNGIIWFEFKKLIAHPQVGHAVFSRIGGVSKDAYSGLNLSNTVGDDEHLVQQNRSMAFKAAGLPAALADANQVHGDYVCMLHETPNQRIANCDGLLTAKKNIALSIQHADCQAAIFFDPIKNAVACVHAGWRGNCQNIYKKTIDKMVEHYNSRRQDLIVCISPSLGPEKAEFINYKKEFPESFWPFAKDNHFNLWDIARWQLESEGILRDNIEFANICTHSNPDLFYSYRRDGLCGRNLTCVWLKR